MHYALSADQMRAVEERAVAEGVASPADLMERAGAALAAEVGRRVPDGPVLVACGPGNNGGDGWVAARMLHAGGRSVHVVTTTAPGDLPETAAAAARAAQGSGVPLSVVDAQTASPMLPFEPAVIIDALFGFGFHGTIREPTARIIEEIAAARALVISADVPSGVHADTGAISSPAVCAAVTVTFTALKPGLLIYPGATHAGEVVVADLGISGQPLSPAGVLEVPTSDDLRPVLPLPGPFDHKGSRGTVAVVVGSRAYAGAAVLAAHGALRMGPGYVVAVVPDAIADVLRISLPSILVRAVPSSPDGSIARVDAVLSAVSDADAIVVGPGLTTAPCVGEVVRALVAAATVPLALDADALNVLCGDLGTLDQCNAPLVLTPHPGEAARLLGISREAVQCDRLAAAVAIAGSRRTCVLKGPRTVVAGPGRRAVVLAGNAGLARAGSGDVLSGMLGTLLAQGLAPVDAATLAAHLHGRAAEYGTVQLTETCFTSADIVSFLPDAVREVRGG